MKQERIILLRGKYTDYKHSSYKLLNEYLKHVSLLWYSSYLSKQTRKNIIEIVCLYKDNRKRILSDKQLFTQVFCIVSVNISEI